MTIIDEYTADCETRLPGDDRAQDALAKVEEAFQELHGTDMAKWPTWVQDQYERTALEIHALCAAERRLGDAA